ncbi:MAG: heat shock protein DnaJ domain-containing protein [Rhodospirillaceae bacterium]|nr:MAG: heat shock protein DnaJ domain-containing protein [Rhodospirillaceae bacterium]
MDYAVIISAIVLGLSVLATAAKFLDWFLHSDPRTMVRTLRWMALLLVIVAIPLLVMMIMREQYAGAMLLGAAMILVPTFLKWRAILVPLRAAFAQFRGKPPPFEMPPVWQDPAPTDPRALQQAAALLEAYLKQAAPIASAQRHIPAPPDAEGDAGMTIREALDVLGLTEGADLANVHAAHRRLMRGADPDAGGSPYLAAKIDEARDVLVGALRPRARSADAHAPGRPRLLKG